MNNPLEIFPNCLVYKISRVIGKSIFLPLNITVSLTFRCNSCCQTCLVWKKDSCELTKEEYEKIFKSLGKSPFYITFSGGEVFLRNDFVDICKSAYLNCRPKIITIPTNGILYDVIPEKIEKILVICRKAKVIVNFSIDDLQDRHNQIRGVPGNFKKAIIAYRRLQELKLPNLVLGVHTVISKFNVHRIPQIYNFVMQELRPDSYISEIAEEREELGTVGLDITPSPEDYIQAIDFLSREIRKNKFNGLSKITESFRLTYYDIVKKVLKDKKQIIPCYAGIASCHIAPNGDVWACCIKAAKMGNLRDINYDFKKIWFSKRAFDIRKEIKTDKCFCPLANASYTNILCNFSKLTNSFNNL